MKTKRAPTFLEEEIAFYSHHLLSFMFLQKWA